jgi:RNA polymerase sigma-70 factor (ECF subfamily)
MLARGLPAPPTPAPAGTAPPLAQLRAGEPAALAELFELEASGLVALAFRLLLSREEAEDVVQDLFVGLPEALGRYEERGQFRAWLRAIVVRMALMRLRRSRRHPLAELAVATPVATPPVEPVRRVSLVAALATLPEEQRVVVVLRVIEGYRHDEIAELLGIRRNTSEVRLHRGLSRLRELLEEP